MKLVKEQSAEEARREEADHMLAHEIKDFWVSEKKRFEKFLVDAEETDSNSVVWSDDEEDLAVMHDEMAEFFKNTEMEDKKAKKKLFD